MGANALEQCVRGEIPHKCELNKAVLVKLLNGTPHFGLSATAVFLINNGYIFYPSGLQKDSTIISTEYPLSVYTKFYIFRIRNRNIPVFSQGSILPGMTAAPLSSI